MIFSNLDLLPQKQDSILTDRKNKIQLLLLAKKITALSIEALELFIKKKLSSFDAQVGENLCQIRAYKILLLGKKFLSNQVPHIENDLENLKVLYEKINPLIYKMENFNNRETCYNEFLDRKELVNLFFKSNDIYLFLSTDTMFLIFSYFLSISCIRKDRTPLAIDYSKISIDLEISKYLSRKITHHYQKKLSQLSSNFLLDISNEMPCIYDLPLIMPLMLKTTDENRSILPCYGATLTILNHMIYQELPLLVITERKIKKTIKTDKIAFLFLGNKKLKKFLLTDYDKNINSPCMIIRGEAIDENIKNPENLSAYAEKFLNTGINNILLGNTSMHPQYSGKNLFFIKENPFHHLLGEINDFTLGSIKKLESSFIFHKKEALRLGCCKENPKLFHLTHVFCNILSQEFKENKTHFYAKLKKIQPVVN
jgi:hypothetical protein